MKFFRLALVGSIALSAASCVPAMADTVHFSFAFAGEDTGSGVFTASTTATAGQYLVTGVTGTTDGYTITSLIAPGGYPVQDPPANDNKLFDPTMDGGYLDLSGVSYKLSNGMDVNPFFEDGAYYIVKGTNATVDSLRTFTLTPAATVTPEPESMALLGTGALGVLGLVRRRMSL